MASFQNFPEISSFDASICEKNGQLCSLPITEISISGFNSKLTDFPELSDYPEIKIVWESSHTSFSRTMTVITNESAIKKLARILMEEGFSQVIHEAAYPADGIYNLHPWIRAAAQCVLKVKAQYKVFPHLKQPEFLSISQFSETRDWGKSLIRYIAWHPNTFKIAVVSNDDSIRVYTNDEGIVPVLKSGLQKNVACVAWRPFMTGELAVACQNGILIWTLDPNSYMQRPLSQAVVLKMDNNAPVSSIEWSPNGCLLAAASLSSSDVLIWDVDQDCKTPLKRVGFSSSLLKWSPDGSRLCCTTTGNIYRVWTTDTWIPDRWSLSSGTIQSAVWSSCGSYLLFVTSNEPYLYSMCFVNEQLFATSTVPKQALPIADLTKRSFKMNSSIEVGGKPQLLAWCPNNTYLAMSFKETSAIAIFNTTITNHTLNILPSCFLFGVGADYPSFITFQQKYRQKTNTVLTIGWSNGRVQYFPFL